MEFLKNRRAAITDAIYGPAKLLLISVTMIIGVFIWMSFMTNFSPIAAGLPTPGNTSMQIAITNIQTGLYSFDYIFPFIVFGLLLVSLIFAFKTGASIIYAFLSIILWVLSLLISAIFTNIFGEFEKTFPAAAAVLPILTYIMNNMKWLVLIWLFLISVVMFTRNKMEDDRIAASERVFGG